MPVTFRPWPVFDIAFISYLSHDLGPMRVTELPNPACVLGYTSVQLLDLLGPDRFADLTRRLRGPAVECRGRVDCGPHGAVVPEGDLKAFLARR